MRVGLLSVVVVVPLVLVSHVCADYSAREGLVGHNSLFAGLDWTDEELAKVSQLHATASYHALARLVKEKLKTSDVAPSVRRRIEKFLNYQRPPSVFKDFLNDDQKAQVHKHHRESNVDGVLEVISERLQRLPSEKQNAAIEYIQRLSPKN